MHLPTLLSFLPSIHLSVCSSVQRVYIKCLPLAKHRGGMVNQTEEDIVKGQTYVHYLLDEIHSKVGEIES